MNDKMKIIDFNECETWRMKEKGLGGIRGFVKTKENEVYVVKPESLNQTLNEIMAQIILNSLGLSSIEYAFVLINGKHYGALRYIEGLTRLGKKNYKLLSKEQKIEFLKHLFLNTFFDNEDIGGEIYLTQDGKVLSLDYGDAGVKLPLFNIDKKSDYEKSIIMSGFHNRPELETSLVYISSFVKAASKYYFDESIRIGDLNQVVTDVIDGLINSYHSEYEVFLKELLTLHGELLAFIYQEHFNGLIETAEELKPMLNTIFNDMPA